MIIIMYRCERCLSRLVGKVQRIGILVVLRKYNEAKGAAHRDIIGTTGKIALSIFHFDVLNSDITVRCTFDVHVEI